MLLLRRLCKQDPDKQADEVSKWALVFVYMGLGVLVSVWMEIGFWMLAAENQVCHFLDFLQLFVVC